MANQFWNRYQYLPTIGCVLFLIFITIASVQFPGGSQVDTSAVCYSWTHNYLCDVIASEAHNCLPHPYYKIGLLAMICLCGGISMFFFFFTDWMRVKGFWKFIIRWMGLISMICAMLIFTELHNIMIAVASILALPALTGVFITLYRRRLFSYFSCGIMILILMLINNLIYYTDYMIEWLPQIQKISVLCVITWLSIMNWKFVELNLESPLNS